MNGKNGFGIIAVLVGITVVAVLAVSGAYVAKRAAKVPEKIHDNQIDNSGKNEQVSIPSEPEQKEPRSGPLDAVDSPTAASEPTIMFPGKDEILKTFELKIYSETYGYTTIRFFAPTQWILHDGGAGNTYLACQSTLPDEYYSNYSIEDTNPPWCLRIYFGSIPVSSTGAGSYPGTLEGQAKPWYDKMRGGRGDEKGKSAKTSEFKAATIGEKEGYWFKLIYDIYTTRTEYHTTMHEYFVFPFVQKGDLFEVFISYIIPLGRENEIKPYFYKVIDSMEFEEESPPPEKVKPELPATSDEKWCAATGPTKEFNEIFNDETTSQTFGVETIQAGPVSCRSCHTQNVYEPGNLVTDTWSDQALWELHGLPTKWFCSKMMTKKIRPGETSMLPYEQFTRESWANDTGFRCVKENGVYAPGSTPDGCE